MPNLIEVLDSYKVFNYVVKACFDGGLNAMLTTEGDFTIFAPIDSAFDKLKPELMKAIFDKPANEMNLMLYHSVEWSLDTRALEEAKRLRTLTEDFIKVKAKKGNFKIGDASIIKADIEADNGIIHMIDGVLISPDIKSLV